MAQSTGTVVAWRRSQVAPASRRNSPIAFGLICRLPNAYFGDFCPTGMAVGWEVSGYNTIPGAGTRICYRFLWQKWRRGRDSNPRWGISPYSLSRGAPSATRPPLRNRKEYPTFHSGERGYLSDDTKLLDAIRFRSCSHPANCYRISGA